MPSIVRQPSALSRRRVVQQPAKKSFTPLLLACAGPLWTLPGPAGALAHAFDRRGLVLCLRRTSAIHGDISTNFMMATPAEGRQPTVRAMNGSDALTPSLTALVDAPHLRPVSVGGHASSRFPFFPAGIPPAPRSVRLRINNAASLCTVRGGRKIASTTGQCQCSTVYACRLACTEHWDGRE